MGFNFYCPQLDEVSYVIDDNQLDIGLERPRRWSGVLGLVNYAVRSSCLKKYGRWTASFWQACRVVLSSDDDENRALVTGESHVDEAPPSMLDSRVPLGHRSWYPAWHPASRTGSSLSKVSRFGVSCQEREYFDE